MSRVTKRFVDSMETVERDREFAHDKAFRKGDDAAPTRRQAWRTESRK